MLERKHFILAKKLLPIMHSSGKSIIDNLTTTESFATHIEEITSLGYDGNIHGNFAKFLRRNLVPRNKGKIRWAGEILVDWTILETARCLTTKKSHVYTDGGTNRFGEIGEEKFRRTLPFQPPKFCLESNPYTEVASTFGISAVVEYALSGEYDDVFNSILLWRMYYKEPFHTYRYGLNIRNVRDFKKEYITENIERFNIETLRTIACRFFKEGNNAKEFNHYWRAQPFKNIENKEDPILLEIKEAKEAARKIREEKRKQKEKNRIDRMKKENIGGQKQRKINIEMLDKTILEMGIATGNNGAWFCPCGNKTPLIGKTVNNKTPRTYSIVICPNCQKTYYLYPQKGKRNKPPEKIIEINPDYNFLK